MPGKALRNLLGVMFVALEVDCRPSATPKCSLRTGCISIGDTDSQAHSRSAGSNSLTRGRPSNLYFKKFLCFNKILQVILLPSKI